MLIAAWYATATIALPKNRACLLCHDQVDLDGLLFQGAPSIDAFKNAAGFSYIFAHARCAVSLQREIASDLLDLQQSSESTAKTLTAIQLKGRP